MVAAGFTLEDIGHILGVTDRTIKNWRKKHPQIAQAYENGKKHAIKRLIAKAYMAASGYRYKTKKTITTRDAEGNITGSKEEVSEHFEKPDNYMLIYLVSNMVRQVGLEDAEAWISPKRMEVNQKNLNITVSSEDITKQIERLAGSLLEEQPKRKAIESTEVENIA